MTIEERALRWLWPAGQLVLFVCVLAMIPALWSHMHAHNRAAALSIAHRVFILSGIWVVWGLGGLMWMQKFNKERMAND